MYNNIDRIHEAVKEKKKKAKRSKQSGKNDSYAETD